VVVGDPKQIEPVVTLAFTAQQALRLNADIAEWWLPGSTSTQRLADEANQYGTNLPGDDGEVWVVHRCESTGAASGRCSTCPTRSPTAA
jgi:hypothetical protein